MNRLALFLLGSMTGGTAVTIFAAVMFSRQRDQNLADREEDARIIYAEAYRNGYDACKEGGPAK